MTKVELNLPDLLVSDCKQAGLLAPPEVERMLRAQLRKQRLKRLDEILDAADKNPIPPMTTEEIQAEIDAYRAEKRRAAGS